MRLETRANQAIRKNDIVQVISGRESGKSGKVLEVRNAKNRVVIEHVNMVKRHQKATGKKGQGGGIVEKEASVHLSNVLLVCEKCRRPVRVRFAPNKEGRTDRKCVKCGEVVARKV